MTQKPPLAKTYSPSRFSSSGITMFDKLFEFIVKSTTFGFALAFAGSVFLAGNKYNWWDISLSPEHTSYILYATLLGFGMLLARFLANTSLILWSGGEVLILLLKRWRANRNIMERLGELTPRQLASLYWISQNPNVLVHGSLYDDPFRTLCEKQYLTAASTKPQPQGFKVNKAVFRQGGKIAARLPPHLLDQIASGQAPWIR